MFTNNSTVRQFNDVGKRVRVALVGLGRAGQFHLASISVLANQCELKYVVDVNEELANNMAQTFKCKACSDIDVPLNDPEVDAVIIASTTFLHYEHVMKALEAKKAVFTEKPISHDPAELYKVLNEVRQRKLPFLVGFQRRFDAQFVELKRQLDSGSIGAPRVIRSTSRDNPVPTLEYLKISGGLFHDMLCHDFDVINFVTGGQVPESVYTVAHTYNPEIAKMDDCDTAMVTLKYPSGLIASVDTSRVAEYGYDQRLEVFGEKGMALIRNPEQTTVSVATNAGFQSPMASYSFGQRYPQAYASEIEHFFGLVRKGETPTESYLEALVSVERVSTAAELSWRLGRPVRVDEVDGLRKAHA